MPTRIVPGKGPQPCQWMIIGEAPGEVEDVLGEPFVGPSGQLLDKFLVLAGLDRSGMYITNAVPVWPGPGNPKPSAREIKKWQPRLVSEIGQCSPHILLLLGATPMNAVPGVNTQKWKITKVHGRPALLSICGHHVVVIPMYHPAFCLRNPKAMKAAIEDWRNLNGRIATLQQGQPATDYQVTSEVPDTSAAQAAIDFETDSGDSLTAVPIGVGVSDTPGAANYTPLGQHGSAGFVAGDPRTQPGHISLRRFVGAVPRLVAHNAQFEIQLLTRFAPDKLPPIDDTKLAAYLCGYESTHLKDLSWTILGVQQQRINGLLQKYGTLAKAPLDEVTAYALPDPDLTLRLWQKLEPEMKEKGVWQLYDTIERPLIPILAEMTRRGWLVDQEELARLTIQYTETWEQAVHDFGQVAPAVNSNSHPQLCKLLYTDLGLTIKKRSAKTKQPSTDVETLDVLVREAEQTGNARAIEVLAALRRERQYDKLVHTYLADIKRRIDGNGYIHPRWNQCGRLSEDSGDESEEAPQTGRLSSSEPNAQNWPKRTAVGIALRNTIIAPPGYVFMSADIEGEEGRLMAALSGDPYLLKAFAEGRDFHMEAAQFITGLAKPTKDQRFVGKTGNFAELYGCTEDKMLELLRKYAPVLKGTCPPTLENARRIHTWAHNTYRGVFDYWRTVDEFLLRHGYVETLYGRKRWLPEVTSGSRQVREEAIRKGRNMVIQGFGADIIKVLMLKVSRAILEEGLDAWLTWSIHDDLGVAVREEQVPRMYKILSHMTDDLPIPHGVRLPVSVEIGNRWGSMTAYDKYVTPNGPHAIVPTGVSLDKTLVGDVVAAVKKYVVLTEEQAVAVALWAMHTHTFAQCDTTPYLSVTSAVKRSGKTRLLEVLSLLVARPWLTGRCTAAVLVRKIDEVCPTLLLDEADAVFSLRSTEYTEALRGILNTGHRRGGQASVCVTTGGRVTYRDMSTFCPKAISGIGDLPDTVADRSIPIRMLRKDVEEAVSPLRWREATAELGALRTRLAEWGAAQKLPPVELPKFLNDRMAEAWEPLLSIAESQGVGEAARASAKTLCGEEKLCDENTLPNQASGAAAEGMHQM